MKLEFTIRDEHCDLKDYVLKVKTPRNNQDTSRGNTRVWKFIQTHAIINGVENAKGWFGSKECPWEGAFWRR